MFISTREMLGQIKSSRASAEAAIEKALGPDYDWSKISEDPAIRSTIQNLRLNAFSDDALQQIVSALSQQKRQSTNLANTLKSNEPVAA